MSRTRQHAEPEMGRALASKAEKRYLIDQEIIFILHRVPLCETKAAQNMKQDVWRTMNRGNRFCDPKKEW